MADIFKLTKDGKQKLEQEQADLIAQRPLVAERIKTAREFGDLSENAEYAAVKDEQGKNESRISEIDHILRHSQIITEPQDIDCVEVGNTVELKGQSGQRTITVVGSIEADPAKGNVSDESPIGVALLGKKQGDEVQIVTPKAKISYKIVSIS